MRVSSQSMLAVKTYCESLTEGYTPVAITASYESTHAGLRWLGQNSAGLLKSHFGFKPVVTMTDLTNHAEELAVKIETVIAIWDEIDRPVNRWLHYQRQIRGAWENEQANECRDTFEPKLPELEFAIADLAEYCGERIDK